MSYNSLEKTLTIKTFHINNVVFGDKNNVDTEGTMTLNKNVLLNILEEEPLITDLDIKIIKPGDYERFTNCIIDFIPVSAKALGKIGEGITHTLTGVYLMLTVVGSNKGKPSRFGISDGILRDLICLDKAGTPSSNDFIISFDLTINEDSLSTRPGITAAHQACDKYIQIFREKMKKFNGKNCQEKYEYTEKKYFAEKRIALIKQVPGQGAMFDTYILPEEPSGTASGHSIIDFGNAPIVLTPNEYRDGALHAM